MSLDQDAAEYRILPDGRVLATIPLTFGRGRVTIGRNFWTYDDSW